MIKESFKILSGLSGIIIFVIDIIFTYWASQGESWYIYLLNFILLFIAGSIICTNYIQGLTRGISYLFVYKFRGIPKAIGINLVTILFFWLAYVIVNFVFSSSKHIVLYFIVCIVLSTIVAFTDHTFSMAIMRTKAIGNTIENILSKNDKKTHNILPKTIKCPNCDEKLELEMSEREERLFTCPNCDSKIDLNKDIVKICMNCKTVIFEELFRCPKCGTIY